MDIFYYYIFIMYLNNYYSNKVISGTTVGLPWAQVNGASQVDNSWISCLHWGKDNSSPNIIAPRHAFEESIRANAEGVRFK